MTAIGRMKIGDRVRVLVGMFAGHEDSIEKVISADDPELVRYDVRGTGQRWYFAEELEVLA